MGPCVVRAELCSKYGWEFVCARVWSSLERGVCGGGHRGALRESAPHPPLPPVPLIPFTERGFQDPPGLLLSPWLRGGGGRRLLGPAPAPAAPANPPPALSLPSTGWAPSPAALGGRGRKMVANEEGEWRELEPGLPSPISSPVSGRSWGMAAGPKVGEGPCLLVRRWARSGMSWV